MLYLQRLQLSLKNPHLSFCIDNRKPAAANICSMYILFYLLHIYYRERIQNKVKKTGDKTGFFTRLIYIQIKKEMVKV